MRTPAVLVVTIAVQNFVVPVQMNGLHEKTEFDECPQIVGNVGSHHNRFMWVQGRLGPGLDRHGGPNVITRRGCYGGIPEQQRLLVGAVGCRSRLPIPQSQRVRQCLRGIR